MYSVFSHPNRGAVKGGSEIVEGSFLQTDPERISRPLTVTLSSPGHKYESITIIADL